MYCRYIFFVKCSTGAILEVPQPNLAVR